MRSLTQQLKIALRLFAIFPLAVFLSSSCYGQNLKTVKIGNQEWMAENLNVTTFRNGDIIPEAKTSEEWSKAISQGKPAWCYYNNDSMNRKTHGKLYNWHAVKDPRGLAPQGWSIPYLADWQGLVNYLGGTDTAAFSLKNSLGWNARNGNNSSKFSALPGGERLSNAEFSGLGQYGTWWSRQELEMAGVYILLMSSNHNRAATIADKSSTGRYVRCLKDKN